MNFYKGISLWRDLLIAQMRNHLSAMQETRVRSLGQEGPLEMGMAIHSSILAWRIPWTEEPDRPPSTGSQRVIHDWTHSHAAQGHIACNWSLCVSRVGVREGFKARSNSTIPHRCKWSRSLVSDSLRPHGHGIFQARVLEWVAISFSRGSSRPRDRTLVSCIVSRRFTIWAIREVLHRCKMDPKHPPWDLEPLPRLVSPCLSVLQPGCSL